jgi:hypothetical protein
MSVREINPVAINPTPVPTPNPTPTPTPSPEPTPTPVPTPVPTPTPAKSFTENFEKNFALTETGSMSTSANPSWWLNSGGYLFSKDGIGQTVQGDLPKTDPWYLKYQRSNPTDTDNGLHPQNIFRLLTRTKWKNLEQQSYFRITKDNLSKSPERYGTNGLQLMNRYVDENNSYFTSIRVDGTAVIKKKKNGTYYTLAQKKIFPGTYSRATSPNLLPHNTWVGLKSAVTNNSDGTVSIKLFIDKDNSGKWSLIFDIKDTSRTITSAGYAGIRTDFMDVQFDRYSIIEK